MRNWRELSAAEVAELGRLYPTLPNRRLSFMFDISLDAITDHFAKPNGWVKDYAAVRLNTRGTYHVPTAEEEGWVVANFAETPNGDILRRLGISESCLRGIAERHGLAKSEAMIERSRDGARASAVECGRRFDLFRKHASRQWEERRRTGDYGNVGFKKGESNRDRLGEERFREVIEKAHRTRNAAIRRDRLRIHWGMEPKTRLVKNWDGSRDWHKSHYRYIFRKKGYFVDFGESDVYYDDSTVRSPLLEERASRYGLRIMRMEGGESYG